MPFPGINDLAEVRRLHVAIRAIWWNGNPGLGAARPDMTDRIEPTGVIEITRLCNGDLRIGARLMKQPAATLCTDDAVDHAAALVLALPHCRLAFLDNNRTSVGEQGKTEGAA